MRKSQITFRTSSLLLAVAPALLLAACQQQTTSPAQLAPTARGYLSRPLRMGTARLLRPLAPTSRAQLTIVLKPPHRDELAQLAQDVSNRESPRFHQYLEYAEWKERFAPTNAASFTNTITITTGNGGNSTGPWPKSQPMAMSACKST